MTDSQQIGMIQESGIKKFKGACCKDKYEYPWLKHETCCFCCGIRCALLAMFIFMILSGVQEIGLSILFIFSGHRSVFGVTLNAVFGVSSIALGVLGYISVLLNNERLIRALYYMFVLGIFGMIGVYAFAIYEFAVQEIYWLMSVMIVDMVLGLVLWLYVTYKVKKYHELVFAHYQQLGDGL
mmetsp:Transcript_18046/g.28532  ORF Transcript_18046/g.28532 Transcript_18046/m.28532 type:complete len:182 (+) Transcript_18046:94-639(+)